MLTAPGSLEPNSSLGEQANGDVKWSSRYTPTDWGSGRQGQPFHPLLKGHSSTGVLNSTKPLTRTQTPHFSYREEMKLQPSTPRVPPPCGASRESLLPLKPRAGFLCQSRRGCGLSPQCLPPALPERHRKPQRSSQSISANKNNFVGSLQAARATGKMKQLCLKGDKKLPHGCRTLTPHCPVGTLSRHVIQGHISPHASHSTFWGVGRRWRAELLF